MFPTNIFNKMDSIVKEWNLVQRYPNDLKYDKGVINGKIWEDETAEQATKAKLKYWLWLPYELGSDIIPLQVGALTGRNSLSSANRAYGIGDIILQTRFTSSDAWKAYVIEVTRWQVDEPIGFVRKIWNHELVDLWDAEATHKKFFRPESLETIIGKRITQA